MGTDHQEDFIMTLKNGDRIVQNQWAHPFDSTGVHIQHTNGRQTRFPDVYGEAQTRSSYTEQLLFVMEHHDKFLRDRSTPIETNSIRPQIDILQFLELLKSESPRSK